MICAITNYYNPAKKYIKELNFVKFKANITIPLYIVEASFDGKFFSQKDDCCFHVNCKDLLWQQYRLINLIIKKLPEKYDKIVWIDADIIFKENKWEEIDFLLNKYKIIQSYEIVELLDKNNCILETKIGVAKEAIKNSQKSTATTLSGNLDLSKSFASGFSWALQREVVEKFGIYDRWITGSDDIAFVIGIWGDWKNPFFNRMNDNMKNHYFSWAKPFHEYINGSVYYLETTIQHLWHGHRNYKKRWNCLKDYDPAVDVIEKNGVLEWNSNKPHLHKCCEKMCLNYDNEFKYFL